jgi:hypothetical protein
VRRKCSKRPFPHLPILARLIKGTWCRRVCTLGEASNSPLPKTDWPDARAGIHPRPSCALKWTFHVTTVLPVVKFGDEPIQREVQERASVGAAKLRTIALFRATKWVEISIDSYSKNHIHARNHWLRATEWARIGQALST